MNVKLLDIYPKLYEVHESKRDLHFYDNGDPRGPWQAHDLTAPNKVTEDHDQYGVVAVALLEFDGGDAAFKRTLETPGTWGVWATGKDDPYVKEIYEGEKDLLIDMLEALGIEIPKKYKKAKAGRKR